MKRKKIIYEIIKIEKPATWKYLFTVPLYKVKLVVYYPNRDFDSTVYYTYCFAGLDGCNLDMIRNSVEYKLKNKFGNHIINKKIELSFWEETK